MLTVLRLGHRIHRDFRITTHCGLVARAFGAEGIFITGDYDEKVFASLKKVIERFGGPFSVDYVADWKAFIKEHKENHGIVVHLTMYGQTLRSALEVLRGDLGQIPILIIIGAGKVPGDVYSRADYNIAVTNQPHSEISALAVFLDQLQEGNELNKTFRNAQINIIPTTQGKRVEKLEAPDN